jgi:hypothetical protein
LKLDKEKIEEFAFVIEAAFESLGKNEVGVKAQELSSILEQTPCGQGALLASLGMLDDDASKHAAILMPMAMGIIIGTVIGMRASKELAELAETVAAEMLTPKAPAPATGQPERSSCSGPKRKAH